MREEAARLRREGVGRTEIARRLGLGVSTIARWFREDAVPAPRAEGGVAPGRREQALISYQRTVRERWAHQQEEQDAHRDAVGELTDRELLLVGSALYWAEGCKSKPWNRSHRVIFTNSEASMISVFLAFTDLLGIPRNRISCRISIHERADLAAAEAYWRQIVGDDVPFIKPGLKRHTPITARLNTGAGYYGCLTIAVHDGSATYRRIAGSWEGIARAATSPLQSPVV